MTSSGFETLLLVGGSRSGEAIAISCGVKLLRLPKYEGKAIFINKYKDRMPFSIELYRREIFTDPNGRTRKFLLHEDLSADTAATTELYLLGIVDLDGNFETNEKLICQCCSTTSNVERRRQNTMYDYPAISENPNAKAGDTDDPNYINLCSSCHDENDKYWSDMWTDYYSNVL